MGDNKQRINKAAASAISEEKMEKIEAVSQKLFGKTPRRVAFPGGLSRSAFVADIDGQIYVFANREDETSAMLEARVLKALSPTGHAPKFIARSDEWVVQECVPGTRLPVVLDNIPDMHEREQLVSDSLEALLQLHEAARQSGLHHSLQKIGASDTWINKQVTQGDVVSEKLDIPRPDFDHSNVASILDIKHADFVKRDARPGNAMIFEGRPYWFDFEDCGRRRALDDMVWVMSDEWTALDKGAETRLINKFLPLFAGRLSLEESRRYFYTYGIIHMMWRMRLIVRYYLEDGQWWDRDMCLSKDKVGVTPQEAGRLIWRMRRWASEEEIFSNLSSWLDDLEERLNIK